LGEVRRVGLGDGAEADGTLFEGHALFRGAGGANWKDVDASPMLTPACGNA